MEGNSETAFNDQNRITYERYSDEELGLDQIKRKRIYPQCIIDSGSDSEGENSAVKIQKPQNVDLTDSMNSTEKFPDMGADMSDMIQNLMQTRPPGTSTLQCSECDLQCPSLQAFEFHSKLHVMERIVQSSYKYPELGLRKSTDKVKKQKSNALKKRNAKNKPVNPPNSSNDNSYTHTDEARDIETIIESLVSEGSSKNITHTDDKPYACTECDYSTGRKDAFKRHMKRHVDYDGDSEALVESLVSQDSNDISGSVYSEPHLCNQCDLKFESSKELKKHKKTHSRKKKTGIKRIRKRKSTYIKLKDRKRNINDIQNPTNNDITNDKKPFKCIECECRFKTNYYLEAHMLTHLTPTHTQNQKSVNIKIRMPTSDEMTNDKKPFKCTKCNSRFKTKQYFEGHMLTHLTEKCSFCDYRCSKKGLLTRHMLMHTGTKHHECPICDYKCYEKGNLAKHMVIHGDDKPFSCPEEGCEFRCKLKSNLKNHMLKHTCEKPYACHLCDYRCLVKGSLKIHMFKHSGEKPFPCSVCEKRFIVKRELNIHMRIHTKDKQFKCQLCDYRGFTQQHVERHMTKHTGEKPHKCEECGSRFRSCSSLKKHMRTHGIFGKKQFKCHLCNSRYFMQHHLDQHMLTHTGEKPLKCDECGSRFTSTTQLKEHMQTHGIYSSVSDGSSQLPKDSPYHSEVSNASSQAHQTTHQGNTQPINNQHIIGANSTMGRSSQESTYPNVNYKMFSNNMDYHSFSKIYSNFPSSAKPLWNQGGSSLPTVNNAAENIGNIPQNYSHNPLTPYSQPMFLNSLDLSHLNSRIPSSMQVPPNMSERIQHANNMHNLQ